MNTIFGNIFCRNCLLYWLIFSVSQYHLCAKEYKLQEKIRTKKQIGYYGYLSDGLIGKSSTEQSEYPYAKIVGREDIEKSKRERFPYAKLKKGVVAKEIKNPIDTGIERDYGYLKGKKVAKPKKEEYKPEQGKDFLKKVDQMVKKYEVDKFKNPYKIIKSSVMEKIKEPFEGAMIEIGSKIGFKSESKFEADSMGEKALNKIKFSLDEKLYNEKTEGYDSNLPKSFETDLNNKIDSYVYKFTAPIYGKTTGVFRFNPKKGSKILIGASVSFAHLLSKQDEKTYLAKTEKNIDVFKSSIIDNLKKDQSIRSSYDGRYEPSIDPYHQKIFDKKGDAQDNDTIKFQYVFDKSAGGDWPNKPSPYNDENVKQALEIKKITDGTGDFAGKNILLAIDQNNNKNRYQNINENVYLVYPDAILKSAAEYQFDFKRKYESDIMGHIGFKLHPKILFEICGGIRLSSYKIKMQEKYILQNPKFNTYKIDYVTVPVEGYVFGAIAEKQTGDKYNSRYIMKVQDNVNLWPGNSAYLIKINRDTDMDSSAGGTSYLPNEYKFTLDQSKTLSNIYKSDANTQSISAGDISKLHYAPVVAASVSFEINKRFYCSLKCSYALPGSTMKFNMKSNKTQNIPTVSLKRSGELDVSIGFAIRI